MENDRDIDQLCINAIRMLSVDAVEKAQSGHPGAPMGLAPVGYTLWTRFLKHNPGDPYWPGRDRFVLSAGHASMLLYSLLYLTGYELSLEDIKSFRQLGSKTPGHPEYGITPGVEITTGPLGQGLSSAVGMALARKIVGARFNRPGFDLTDYHVYTICSDGDLMEGVSSEACSLAGHLGLDGLVCLYDNNRITIEGSTDLSFSEDVAARFRAYGWYVDSVEDANDTEAVSGAIESAGSQRDRPSLVMITSAIACGSPNLEGCESSHGAPLGDEEVALTRKNLGWPEEQFFVPGEALDHMREAVSRGAELQARWNEMFESYREEYPEAAAEWLRVMDGTLPVNWQDALPSFEPGAKVATRAASGKVLESLAPVVPELVGGSADLGPSNKTYISGYPSISRDDFTGRNIHFGVREHAMGSVLNGMALHGGLIPYGGTFLVFSDYMRPSVRMASLMGLHVIYVFSHDSLGVGEDGPTHQPIEQVAALRAIPGLAVVRPADAEETVESWRLALEEDGPVALVLSRQKLPVLKKDTAASVGVPKGGYVIRDCQGTPGILLLATGSEVSVAVEARGLLLEKGIESKVVSLPCWEVFERQEPAYRATVLPPGVPRLAVEAGTSLGWERYTGENGNVVAYERFGMSAPGSEALLEAGFSPANVAREALRLLD